MPNPALKLTIIGTGNVASHLALALGKKGLQVLEVYGRNASHATQIAELLPGAVPTQIPDFTRHQADIYLVALADRVVPEFVQQAVFPENSLVVHTSGSLPMEVLQQSHNQIRVGVFYPLQTFSKQRPVNFEDVPLLIEAGDPGSLQQLELLAGLISKTVQPMSFDLRKKIHLSAVFACNFTNHLLGISYDLVQQHKLDWELLKPLINETLAKALEQPPFSVQTGPAIRHDQNILDEQLEQLTEAPLYQQIYRLLTESIQQKSVK